MVKNCYMYLNDFNELSDEEMIRNEALIDHEDKRIRHSLRRKIQRNKYTKRVKLFTNLWNGFSPEKVPAYAHALKSCSIPCKGWDNDDGETEFRIRKNEKAVKKMMNNIHLELNEPKDEFEEYEHFLWENGCYSI